jgi:hypothetical protein
MIALLSAGLISFAFFLKFGGQIQLIPLPNKIFENFKFKKRNNLANDQIFLEYLWDLKSELSSGALLQNLKLIAPNHTFNNQLDLVLSVCSETGAPVTPTINRFIKQIRDQIGLKQEVNNELASTKATVYVLAALPIVGLLLSTLISSNSLRWLFTTAGGHLCLGAAVVLNLIGINWINRIIKRALKT